jgi:uncharacterized protein YaiE (UPF0345 family)
MSKLPERFNNVSVHTKANLYFDGRVASHTVIFPDGGKKTLGLIYPGSFTFKAGAPEEMAILSGTCRVRLEGGTSWKTCGAGKAFSVPGNSSFEIAVEDGVVEYVCSFG